MSEASWPYRPLPGPGSEASMRWAGEASTLVEVSRLRKRLRAAVAEGLTPPCFDDDPGRLLLAFEELASNAVRHGRPPARVAVTPTGFGWLLEIRDAAIDRPPTPALDREPGHGGMGLNLVAKLSADHGWVIEDGHKCVWAHLVCTADGPSDGLVDRLRDTVTELTAALPGRPTIRVSGRPAGLREDIVTDLFAVLHESLANVVRHARANTVTVDLTVTSGLVTLQVIDDGVGMQGTPRRGCCGLGDIRRRAIWHGGKLAVGPSTAGGTQLIWSVPARWSWAGASRGGRQPDNGSEARP